MAFDEVLAQVIELLRREGRLSYRAFKRRFSLDDEYFEDIKSEIIEAPRCRHKSALCRAGGHPRSRCGQGSHRRSPAHELLRDEPAQLPEQSKSARIW